MWDGESGFFYDLHYQTDEKAYVKNIVGAFPFFAGITDENHVKCMETLFSEEFDTGCPFPSVSKECKVFTPEGGWMGQFFKGRNGCIWDGPAWPYANSIIPVSYTHLDAACSGKCSCNSSSGNTADFGEILCRYAHII